MAPPLLLAAVLLAGLFAAPAARADDLTAALADAYTSNPQLLAARRELAARDTLRPQALSGWMPTVTLGAGVSRSRNALETAVPTNTRTTYSTSDRNAALQLSLNLYRGGSDTAQLDQAELLILAQRATLQQVEQDVLLAAAEAVFDVERDRRILGLRELNLQNLRALLQGTQTQYDLGERTAADLAQAQSRAAQAEAAVSEARAALEISESRFLTTVGRGPGPLSSLQPAAVPVPSTEEIERAAEEDNPTVLASRFQAEAAARQLRVVEGEQLPSVDVTATLSRQHTGSHNPVYRQDQDQATIGLQVSVPLYQGGQVGARVREASQTEAQRRHELEDSRRRALDLARQARQSLLASVERRVALQEAVRAAEVAIAGLRREGELGLRSLIDVLNAQQELVEAQINLAGAERDDYANRYRLLSAQGLLTARGLELPVELYDPEENYRRERWRVGPID